MNIMRRISKEYEEPFVDVVKGFAAMRFGKAETARTLGMSRQYFYELLDRFNLHDYFVSISKQRRDGRKSRKGTTYSGTPVFTDAELVNEVMKYRNSTDFKANSEISYSTIYRRFGGFHNARSLHNG